MSPDAMYGGFCNERNVRLDGQEVRAEADENHFIKEILYNETLNTLKLTHCRIPPCTAVNF